MKKHHEIYVIMHTDTFLVIIKQFENQTQILELMATDQIDVDTTISTIIPLNEIQETFDTCKDFIVGTEVDETAEEIEVLWLAYEDAVKVA